MSGHRSRLCYITIDVADLDAGVAFWTAALDAEEQPVSKASRHVYRQMSLPDSAIWVLLQATDDNKVSKERMHLDLETDDVDAEVRRLRTPRRYSLGPPARARLRLLGHARSVGKRVLRAPNSLPRPAR